MNDVPEDRRCRRGKHCSGREKVVTTTDPAMSCECSCHLSSYATCTLGEGEGCAHLHPEQATETVTYLGKALETTDGLCWTCTGKVRLALAELADGHLLAGLVVAHLPSMEIKLRHVDITSGEPLYPPLLLNEYVDALLRWIDHEVTDWAEAVADAAGVPWDSQITARTPLGARVRAGCQLLDYRIDQWLALPEREYRARSLGHDCWDALGQDDVTRYRDDYWCHRDGIDAALVVMDLHYRAARFVGGGNSDWMPGSLCKYCTNEDMHRIHDLGVVRCGACGDTMTDKAYDEWRDEGVRAVLAAIEASNAEAAALADLNLNQAAA